MLNAEPFFTALAALAVAARRAEYLKHLTHLRMDRLRLHSLPSSVVKQMPALTHVYLQHNRIDSMAALAVLPNLRFVTLRNNLISRVEGVAGLQHIMLLDLAFNDISEVSPDALPTSLRFVKVR